MNSHFFLLGGKTTPERLSWLEGALKYFFMKIAPESLLHHEKKGGAIFTIFVTGRPCTVCTTRRHSRSGISSSPSLR